MKRTEMFPFERARRIRPEEVEANRQAIEALTGKARARRPGRPPMAPADRRLAISIRLDPAVIAWAKAQAKVKQIGYQTVINDTLMACAKRAHSREKAGRVLAARAKKK